MENFIVLMDKETEAIALVKRSSPYADEYAGWEKLYSGTNNNCLSFIDNWWNENYIPDERRMMLQVR